MENHEGGVIMTPENFVERLQEYFYQQQPKPYFLATLRDYLAELPERYLGDLFELVIRSCKWMPTVAELVELKQRIHVEALRLPEPEITDGERAEGLGILADCLKIMRPQRVNQTSISGLRLVETKEIHDQREIRRREEKRRLLEGQSRELAGNT